MPPISARLQTESQALEAAVPGRGQCPSGTEHVGQHLQLQCWPSYEGGRCETGSIGR